MKISDFSKNKKIIVLNVIYLSLFLGISIIMWINKLDNIMQPIAMSLFFLLALLPCMYWHKKNIPGYLLIAFFTAVIFISIYVINSSINNSSRDLAKDVQLYGIISGSFFWSSFLIFVIFNAVKHKKDFKMWKQNLIIQGKIILKSLIMLLILIVFWVLLLYVWKGIDMINMNVAIKKTLLMLISWVSFSIIFYLTLSILQTKPLFLKSK